VSSTVREISLIFYLIRGMGFSIKFPIMLITENIDAIFMTENASSGVRNRHIDNSYHLIREHFEDSFIKILFAKADNNH
jgi:hypothetical protein